MTADPVTDPTARHPGADLAVDLGAVAAVVVAASTIWRASIVGRGWFSQNDFLVTLCPPPPPPRPS